MGMLVDLRFMEWVIVLMCAVISLMFMRSSFKENLFTIISILLKISSKVITNNYNKGRVRFPDQLTEYGWKHAVS